VTEFSITNQIYHHIMVELLPVQSCCSKCKCHVFNAISIYMENWRVNSFGNVRSVVSRTTFLGNSCKADLIIANDMDCSTNCVILKVLHLQGLVNNTLACDRGISMDKEWH